MYNPEIDWYNFEGNIIAEDEMREEICKEVRSIRPSEFVKKVISYGNIDDYFDALYDYVLTEFSTEELVEMLNMSAVKVDVND